MLDITPLFPEHTGPILARPTQGRLSLLDIVVPQRDNFRSRLTEHGAILFRGFRVDDVSDFHALVDGLTSDHMRYIYRSTPRSVVTDRVSTATSYPAQLEIPLHNENSYSDNWPLTVAFCCTKPAVEGGETPVACMRDVTRDIGSALLNKFQELGVEYIRHYHQGVDLPWQDVFQTTDKGELQNYCDSNGISTEWLDGDLLRTVSRAQGAAEHPGTGDRVFFNQAHLFHVSSLGQGHAEALTELFGLDRLPRHARFGDGSEISAEELARINDAFRKNTLAFPWQTGDVLWVDNMQYAHGRRPFKGERAVFASLMEPYHPKLAEAAA
ncbi:alpha-ketoglutarate-dependent taurine dioxygenase [Rhodanobacter sp. K2T2]|uniref:TauD/TfdA family dioxygenase n=1 Tax=Rhodanobacter sp. K2T2 TaxID=2723085 RepID=UPI0015CEA276|nr:TauD/TfdA family dioxygenase [Rhodanobacter sp. K2T2]NYE28914.1 alpha-ketoglutarate-dependent taurine dioxygenase [Rhodanobacter sp. K2T2]